jgi:hypothetical protein
LHWRRIGEGWLQISKPRITPKMPWRLAPNWATLARALGEAEVTCLRDTIVREHHVSLVSVAGVGKPHPGSESVNIDALGSLVQYLVHFQERCFGMWYTIRHANTLIHTPAHGGRAGHPGDRSPVPVRLDGPPLSDSPRQCRGPVDDHHCTPLALHRPDGAQCSPCVPPARPHGAATAIVTPAHHRHDLRRWHLRVPPGAVAPESPDLRLALRRLRVSWKRAKQWITSPDPAYARKKTGVTG